VHVDVGFVVEMCEGRRVVGEARVVDVARHRAPELRVDAGLLRDGVSERRQVRVVGPGRGSQVAEVTVATEPPWALRLVLADGSVAEVVAADLFEALEKVRLQLEADGLMVCCQGARADVFPSGMARQMGGGRRAYRLRRDRPVGPADLVDVLDPAQPGEVVTVAEQYAAVRSFYERGRGP
jgi:hypothetical protein